MTNHLVPRDGVSPSGWKSRGRMRFSPSKRSISRKLQKCKLATATLEHIKASQYDLFQLCVKGFYITSSLSLSKTVGCHLLFRESSERKVKKKSGGECFYIKVAATFIYKYSLALYKAASQHEMAIVDLSDKIPSFSIFSPTFFPVEPGETGYWLLLLVNRIGSMGISPHTHSKLCPIDFAWYSPSEIYIYIFLWSVYCSWAVSGPISMRNG